MTPHAHDTAAAVEEMLLDAGLGQDLELRRALLAVGSWGDVPVPAPSGQLAALLGAGTCDAPEEVRQGTKAVKGKSGDELGQRRRLRAHRPTVVGLALIAGMGMGAGAVAASPAGPAAPAGSLSVQQLLEDWSPSWTIHSPWIAESVALQAGVNDGGGDARGRTDSRLPGTGATLAGDPQEALQQPPQGSGEGQASPPAGQHREEPGASPEADGQGGMTEPAEKVNAAAQDEGPAPHRPGLPDAGTSNGDAPADQKSGHGAGPAPAQPAGPGEGGRR